MIRHEERQNLTFSVNIFSTNEDNFEEVAFLTLIFFNTNIFNTKIFSTVVFLTLKLSTLIFLTHKHPNFVKKCVKNISVKLFFKISVKKYEKSVVKNTKNLC